MRFFNGGHHRSRSDFMSHDNLPQIQNQTFGPPNLMTSPMNLPPRYSNNLPPIPPNSFLTMKNS